MNGILIATGWIEGVVQALLNALDLLPVAWQFTAFLSVIVVVAIAFARPKGDKWRFALVASLIGIVLISLTATLVTAYPFCLAKLKGKRADRWSQLSLFIESRALGTSWEDVVRCAGEADHYDDHASRLETHAWIAVAFRQVGELQMANERLMELNQRLRDSLQSGTGEYSVLSYQRRRYLSNVLTQHGRVLDTFETYQSIIACLEDPCGTKCAVKIEQQCAAFEAPRQSPSGLTPKTWSSSK